MVKSISVDKKFWSLFEDYVKSRRRSAHKMGKKKMPNNSDCLQELATMALNNLGFIGESE